MALFDFIRRRKAEAEATPAVNPGYNPSIADLVIGGWDQAGYKIVDIFGRKPPDYAVYGNTQRVAVQYADDVSEAGQQRKAMAPLNPLRGQISGLIDGWRSKADRSAAKDRAQRYDRRVADALVVGFEGDVPSAQTLLDGVKQDILSERTAWGRFWYLIDAFATGLAALLLVGLVAHVGHWGPLGTGLTRAAFAGAVGAFFSIALAIRGRTVLPDLQWIANAMDAVLRIVIGVIAACVLMALVESRAVTLSLGDARLPTLAAADSNAPGPPAANAMAADANAANAAPAPPAANTATATPDTAPPPPVGQAWLYALIVGFIAGFSERFVPDLLAKTTTAGAGPAPANPAATATGAGQPPPPPPPNPQPAAEPEDEDPHPEQAAIDACPDEAPLTPDEAVDDKDLPPASGGVAPST